jgi:hypothetical protein
MSGSGPQADITGCGSGPSLALWRPRITSDSLEIYCASRLGFDALGSLANLVRLTV